MICKEPAFDLEAFIADWRRQMFAAGIKPEPMDELENHLREEIEWLLQMGVGEHEAFDTAVQTMGRADELKAEFTKINQFEIRNFMKNIRFASHLSLLAVMLSAAWLVFSAIMIGTETLFPHDGLTGFRASAGSLVHVQNGAAVLQSPGTLSSAGVNEYHLYPMLFGLGIPFAVLVAFAVVGCRSLFAKKPSDVATA